MILMQPQAAPEQNLVPLPDEPATLKLFLCGDVMLGRGIDQVLPHPLPPQLYESYVKDARAYVRLAEKANGPLPKPITFAYPWGDALQVWKTYAPDVKVINLETSITCSAAPWPQKEVCYRMHPRNIPVLSEAGITFCSLANNHVLDWQRPGLLETLQVLETAGISYAGAGRNLAQAQIPAILPVPKKGRLIILAYGSPSSGVPAAWAATAKEAGVNLLPDLSPRTISLIKKQVAEVKQPGDVVLFSVHWGPNWGYNIPLSHQKFAHALIDEAGVDLVFGHSSHHPLGLEVYKGKLVLYGAGDFINDYEGIKGHESYRADLSLMYFPEIDVKTGQLVSLTLVPMQIRNFRLNSVNEEDLQWLADVLNRESEPFGLSLSQGPENALKVRW